MSDRKRLHRAAGQSTTEYVLLMGMTTSIGVVVFNVLAGSIRQALKTIALAILSTVTGAP
jgi:hypothetical protein